MTNNPNPNPYDGVPSYGAYNNNPYGQDANHLVPNPRPGAGRRLGATLIDMIIIGIIATAITSLAGIETASLDPGPMFVSSLISLIVWFIARVGSEVAWGATPGKRLLGMKVVTADGSNPDAVSSLKRNSWYAAQIIPFVGFFVYLGLAIFIGVKISNDPEKRSWFDKFGDLSVIRTS
ncbi:RDD family protein [Corynebacterium sp. AOP40-9SA-29]|uniref:RDD family protein n=1 Tax=Corynebacterium sp. AOP40-9SA-29 TaxID=3457677 RepID=UPI00403326DF